LKSYIFSAIVDCLTKFLWLLVVWLVVPAREKESWCPPVKSKAVVVAARP
jgi:hypothetical protein